MVDREISAGTVVAYLLWALSLALCAVAWIMGDINIGRLSLITCGAAVTATVRTYFVAQSERITTAMAMTVAVQELGTVRPLH